MAYQRLRCLSPPADRRAGARVCALPHLRVASKRTRAGSPQAAAACAAPPRSVGVDQEKLDVLMGAIGELLVAKNALPVPVARVRESHGVRSR